MASGPAKRLAVYNGTLLTIGNEAFGEISVIGTCGEVIKKASFENSKFEVR